MLKELFASKGDPAAYVEIFMKFYQRKLANAKSSMKTIVDSSEGSEDVGSDQEVGDSIRSLLESEIDNEELKAYAKMVDDDYEKEMISAVSD